MNKEEIELKEEARKIYGKREMLWSLQCQIYGAKIKGKVINENLIMQILEGLENMQTVEEANWNMEQYIESDIELDIVKESKMLNTKIKGV